jgi:hypothetical protein
VLYFHACQRFTFTLNSAVGSWAKHLKQRVISVPYSQIDPREPMPAGVHIFTDFERLRPGETRYVQALVDRMAQHPGSYTVLNNPAAWSGRLGLNQALSAEGINDYRAFAADEVPDDLSFPAFVRFANQHTGSLADPVHSFDEINRLVRQHTSGRKRRLRKDLLVVEQLNAQGPDGIYRKYGALKIGDRLFPRHICFSHNWVTKDPTLIAPHLLAEEQAYLDSFEHHNFDHAEQLNQAFKLAGLDYGRIDYGFVNGRLQVWEINTNPIVASRRAEVEPERLASQDVAVGQIMSWLEHLADTAPTGPDVRLFSRVGARVVHRAIGHNARYDAARK